MSDPIKHECGLAFIRLRKPFSYYHQKYGTVLWGLNKLYLLMEKQHNRGQDGAGIATVKLDVEPGYPFMNRMRSNATQAIADIFQQVGKEVDEMIELMHTYLCREDEASPEKLDIKKVLKKALPIFDGGFHVGGLTGNGIGFVFRDAHGIRPSYYYIDNEVVVAASERAAIRTSFNVGENEVKELMPGQALIVDEKGVVEVAQILEPKERKACSFERIYFSRGSDEKIYQERNQLGYNLTEQVLNAIDHDLKNTIFSFIPNTAETAFYGMLKGMEDFLNKVKIERILSWGRDYDPEKLKEMINRRIRIEKVAIKDVKMRTFITEDASRSEMLQHVYDVTYGKLKKNVDTLVVIDDSIVRGTTLRESIIRMLSRLKPKKIIIVSSSPQIRYPDCYGIDMSKMGDFIAFNAAVELMKERGKEDCMKELYQRCIDLQRNSQLHTENVVKRLYQQFTTEEISRKIAQLITPPEISVPVDAIFQSIEDLHKACPNNLGDWDFTGNYPTAGGNKDVTKAFINYIEGKN